VILVGHKLISHNNFFLKTRNSFNKLKLAVRKKTATSVIGKQINRCQLENEVDTAQLIVTTKSVRLM